MVLTHTIHSEEEYSLAQDILKTKIYCPNNYNSTKQNPLSLKKPEQPSILPEIIPRLVRYPFKKGALGKIIHSDPDFIEAIINGIYGDICSISRLTLKIDLIEKFMDPMSESIKKGHYKSIHKQIRGKATLNGKPFQALVGKYSEN